MLARIQRLAKEIAPRLIEIRRHIHSHPELSDHEYQTAAHVASGIHLGIGLLFAPIFPWMISAKFRLLESEVIS